MGTVSQNPADFADWPEGLHREMLDTMDNGLVGSVLVSETDRVRVWHLTIHPGERCGFHTHVLPYFWTCHSDGVARTYGADGSVTDVTYRAGDTRHLDYGLGESMSHNLENIGKTPLTFTTVEFLDGANPPYPVPAARRRAA